MIAKMHASSNGPRQRFYARDLAFVTMFVNDECGQCIETAILLVGNRNVAVAPIQISKLARFIKEDKGSSLSSLRLYNSW